MLDEVQWQWEKLLGLGHFEGRWILIADASGEGIYAGRRGLLPDILEGKQRLASTSLLI